MTDDPQLIAGWQPFFTVTGGAAAALAGLLFVALSIHARDIADHPAFRYRALATLSIPLVVLVVSALALVPRQTGSSLGLEELVPLLLQICGVLAWLRRARAAAKMARSYELRSAIGLTLVVLAIFGCALLFVGFEIGLAIVGAFCLISLVWMAFNSWALLFAIAAAETVEVEALQAVEPAGPAATTP